jgi:hypothetical protein
VACVGVVRGSGNVGRGISDEVRNTNEVLFTKSFVFSLVACAIAYLPFLEWLSAGSCQRSRFYVIFRPQESVCLLFDIVSVSCGCSRYMRI